jgi:hypothetical protein
MKTFCKEGPKLVLVRPNKFDIWGSHGGKEYVVAVGCDAV